MPFPNNVSNLQQFPDLIIAGLETLWHRIVSPGEHSGCTPTIPVLLLPTFCRGPWALGLKAMHQVMVVCELCSLQSFIPSNICGCACWDKKAECVGRRKTNCWFWGNKQHMVVPPLWKGLEGSQLHAHPSLLLLQHPSWPVLSCPAKGA